MYTIKDLASEKFRLLNESDLLKIDDVKGITISSLSDRRKKITVHIGLYDYLFSGTLKSALKTRIQNDLGSDFDINFGI